MKIEKSFDLQYSREFVWSRMNDVRFVARCLPGASIVEDLGEHRYKGRMTVKVGPMAAAFDGEISIDSQPQQWTAIVSGKGADSRSSSRATGAMTYRLAEGRTPGATRVEVVSDINLAGPLAQFSKGAVMQEVANRITAEFVKNFESALSAPAAAGQAGAAEPLPSRGLARRRKPFLVDPPRSFPCTVPETLGLKPPIPPSTFHRNLKAGEGHDDTKKLPDRHPWSITRRCRR